MKFLVMGSVKTITDSQQKTDFCQACQQLGKKLAEAGHTIIINSVDAGTADLHVLEGVDKASGHHQVILLQSMGETDIPFRFVGETDAHDRDDLKDVTKFKTSSFRLKL